MTDISHRRILHDALVIAIADGAVGISFGAVAVSAGLSVIQALLLSLVAFTGGSQFALAGVIGTGGAPLAGTLSALMLGLRNGVYGTRLATLLPRRRRALLAHLIIDESTGMALAQKNTAASRRAFITTGVILFALWNLGTLIGAEGGRLITDPHRLGLDATGPAVFAAMLAPQLSTRQHVATVASAMAVTLAVLPFVPAGVPILVVTAGVVLWSAVTR